MTHSVNSLGWLLAVTEAYSRSGKSIEHAVPENAGMITIGKCYCMPILPCLHIVSCPFVLIARGLNDVFCGTPRPFPQTNYSQTGKAIRQMQLAYKDKWMELQTLSDSLCFLHTGINTHSLNFPHSIFIFKLCLFLRGTMPNSLYRHSDLCSVNPFNLEILLKRAS